jgi:ABC-type molybdate transport system substrate-binding protein
MEHQFIAVSQLIGNYGITLDDGDALYAALHPLLTEGRRVTLDFAGVTIFASPFFNASIGRLLAYFSSDFLNAHLTPVNLSAAGQGTLRRVIENAKAYHGSAAVQDAVDQVLDEQALVA